MGVGARPRRRGQDTIDVRALRGLLDNASHRVVARLLCPRRLEPRTAYTAFLVPTLEAARLSALGLPVNPRRSMR